MDVERQKNWELIRSCNEMFICRTKETETEFKEKVEKLKNKDFSDLLKKDMPHFLPSEVDKLYHRGILTSNAAETTFSVLKSIIALKIRPLFVIIEVLMYISISWMKKKNPQKKTLQKST